MNLVQVDNPVTPTAHQKPRRTADGRWELPFTGELLDGIPTNPNALLDKNLWEISRQRAFDSRTHNGGNEVASYDVVNKKVVITENGSPKPIEQLRAVRLNELGAHHEFIENAPFIHDGKPWFNTGESKLRVVGSRGRNKDVKILGPDGTVRPLTRAQLNALDAAMTSHAEAAMDALAAHAESILAADSAGLKNYDVKSNAPGAPWPAVWEPPL